MEQRLTEMDKKETEEEQMARLLRKNEELKLQIRQENERIKRINVIKKAKSKNEKLKLQLVRRNEKMIE